MSIHTFIKVVARTSGSLFLLKLLFARFDCLTEFLGYRRIIALSKPLYLSIFLNDLPVDLFLMVIVIVQGSIDLRQCQGWIDIRRSDLLRRKALTDMGGNIMHRDSMAFYCRFAAENLGMAHNSFDLCWFCPRSRGKWLKG